MAMTVSTGTSSVGRGPSHGSYEMVTVDFSTGLLDGIASDNITLSGQVLEVITVPGTGDSYMSDSYTVRLRDPADSSIDYLAGTITGHSDCVSYHEPLVSAITPPVVAGEVEFHVSDQSGTLSDAAGSVKFLLKS